MFKERVVSEFNLNSETELTGHSGAKISKRRQELGDEISLPERNLWINKYGDRSELITTYKTSIFH